MATSGIAVTRSRMARLSLLVSFAIVLGTASFVLAQGTDTEPNNTCATAQAFADFAIPYTIIGSLSTPPTPPDVDFFTFTATPNSVVIVDYEGQATGQGTLQYPYLGLFDSSCRELRTDYDSGVGPNSRLGFAVPVDGTFILAASSSGDYNFTGEGNYSGSYRLTVTSGGRITGTVADSQGTSFYPDTVAAFTPSGDFAGYADITCCPDNTLTYDLFVAPGDYRVVVEGPVSRVWHQNKPAFLQADTLSVAANAHITGIDFTLPTNVRVEPRLSRSDFVTGDTAILDLQLQNLSPNQALIAATVSANLPAEPGINQDEFCCFENSLDLLQEASISIPPNTDTVVRNFFSYQFSGGEPAGEYSVCVRVVQSGQTWRYCDYFTFTP